MALAGRGFLAWYNARLTSHPYSVKAFGTGATYVASDCTAQAIEGEQGVALDHFLEAPPYLCRGPVVIAPVAELVRAVK